MSRYNNPRSNRKQKARAKREQREFCEAITKRTPNTEDGAQMCLSPDEFIRLEQTERFTPVEVTVIKRKRKHKEPKILSAAA